MVLCNFAAEILADDLDAVSTLCISSASSSVWASAGSYFQANCSSILVHKGRAILATKSAEHDYLAGLWCRSCDLLL